VTFPSDLDDDLAPVAMFYVERPDKDPATELQRVAKFRRDLRKALPAARIIAIPNAGKRGIKALAQAKAEGAAWGAPDMIVLWNGEEAFLEWKGGKNKPAPHQIDWLNWLHANGYPCAVVRTSGGAFSFLRSIGWRL
jgi:hypothetical protein